MKGVIIISRRQSSLNSKRMYQWPCLNLWVIMNPKFWPILPSKKDSKWLKISLNRVYVTKSLFTRHLFPFFPKNIIRGGGRTATFTANSQVLTQLKMVTLGRVAKMETIKDICQYFFNDRILSQSSEPRWPEGGARGKAWQEDRLVLEDRVYKFWPKSTSNIRIMDIVLDRSLFAGITPLTPEQGEDRGTSAETGAMLLLVFWIYEGW